MTDDEGPSVWEAVEVERLLAEAVGPVSDEQAPSHSQVTTIAIVHFDVFVFVST